VAPDSSGVAKAGRLLRALWTIRREASDLNEARCDRGARIVAQTGFSPEAAVAVRALDENWDGNGRPDGLVGDAIPLISRITCLAQSAEVFMSAGGPEAAIDVVRARRGRWFDPEIADVFLGIGPDDPLWARIVADAAAEVLRDLEPEAGLGLADEDGVDRVAEAFAQAIDAKSPYTARHRQARHADRRGVHGGPAPPPYRFQILSRITPFADIAEAAAAHHERLDGRGYHRGVGAEHLSPEARILAVADVFDALTADRPYRRPLDRDAAFGILRKEVGSASTRSTSRPSRAPGPGFAASPDRRGGRHVTISGVGFVPSARN